jgi:Putative Ig domain/Kelch motif
VVYAVGQPIIPNKPSGRGTVDSFSIEPALPVGLTIDSHTGVISGTPASASAATIYEVKATNAKGSAVGRIQIEIIDHVIVPDSLRYSLESAIYAAGQEIVPNMPITTGGEITQFTVGPGLPLGLSLNPQTGVISGAPLFAQPATQYTVTGANSAGNVQTSISIAVQLAVVPPPVVVPPSPQTMNWQPMPPMHTRRDSHTATVMPNGQVLVAGGSDISNTALSSVEIFDPASRQWLAAASMANSRTAHTATLLPDGRLLVVGGKGASYLASSELFDITRNGAQVAATMRH